MSDQTERPPEPTQETLIDGDSTPQRRPRRYGPITSEERDTPYTDQPRLREMEEQAARSQPDQLQLFAPGPAGQLAPLLGGLPPLNNHSSLDLARSWYRQYLEGKKRPANTIESYCYDLMKLEEQTGPKQISKIYRADIATFLGLANTRSTRKRRLTSVRRFFHYLIDDAKVLSVNPTEGFYPHTIQLKAPVPLFPDEQEALLAAAAEDEPWSLTAIWLMMRLGLARSELLQLRREHIDLSDPDHPVVYVVYDDATKRVKERHLAGDPEFARIYADFLDARSPADLLFPVGFQAVNAMVGRVRDAAEITKEITPAILRHTFAVERAKDGATEEQLLAVLGLADDPRNRTSVRRYIKLAEPPL
jgi:integrase/recombinase XerD